MIMETTNDDYWKDFIVEGQRVKTISKDAKNNTRTIIFPYVEGKTLYNAIVKVHVKTIDYDGQYHVRIVDKEAFTKANAEKSNKKNKKITQLKSACSSNARKTTPAPAEKEASKQDNKKLRKTKHQVLRKRMANLKNQVKLKHQQLNQIIVQ